MTTVLYADVLFVINFSMDFLSIYMTAKLLSLRRSTVRFTVAALVGALGGTAITAFGITAVREGILSVLLSLLMTAIAVGYRSIGSFFMNALVLWGAGALIGGAVSVVCSIGDASSYSLMSFDSSPYPIMLFAGALGAMGFVRLVRPHLRKKNTDVTVTLGGKSVTVTALVDSGNLAADPISATPVMFICAAEAVRLLGEENTKALLTCDREGLDRTLLCRLRIIPVDGVSGRAVCFALRPDKVTAGGKGKDVLVAVSDKESTYYAGFPALAPSCVL